MPDEPLPVAVIGLGVFGRLTLQALARSKLVTVIGVADKDPRAAQQGAAEVGVPSYTDNRSLLVETRPRAVYLAIPPMTAGDLLAFCAAQGIHVWKEPPLARDLAEGVAMVRCMADAGLKLAVGTQRRFARTYRRAWELRGRLEQVFLARSHYLFNWGAQLGWRGDRASAGGGALLELAYHSVDLLIWLLGLPEEVYGLAAVGGRPQAPGDEQAQAIHDTDDTAAAILRYAGGRMASVVTTRSSGPVSEELCIHGRGGSLTADSETCLLRDPDGNVLDRITDDSPPVDLFQRQAEAFARAVINDTACECSGRENLLNLAALDAIYLSTRTCHPESPASLLRTCGLTADECLPNRPEQDEGTPTGRPDEEDE